MDSCCDVISFALRSETSCQNNADKNFILSCFVFRCGRNRADKYKCQYFHHVGCREHLERGTVKQVISKLLELTSFVFTKARTQERNTTLPRQHRIEDEAKVTGSCTQPPAFIHLFLYFTSLCHKQVKKKKDLTPGLVQDTLSCSRCDKQAQRFLPSQQDFRRQQSAALHSTDSLFEKY